MGGQRKRIVPPGPFRFRESLVRFQAAVEEPVNRFDGETFRRVIEGETGDLFLAEAKLAGIGPRAPVEIRLRSPGSLPSGAMETAEQALRHIFSWDLDLAPFYRMARRDPDLACWVRRFHGLRPVRFLTVFEALVTAITAQQMNLAFAGRIRARMVRRWGGRLHLDGRAYFSFPRPERLARARSSELHRMKFSTRKAEYVVGVARASVEGDVDEEVLKRLPLEKAIQRLTTIRGVGRWTAEQALSRALGRMDAFPAGDLGVRKMMGRFCFGSEKAEETAARQRARPWSPWESLALTYIYAAWRAGLAPSCGAQNSFGRDGQGGGRRGRGS